jgi:purine-binding chemotaxis protein CheW
MVGRDQEAVQAYLNDLLSERPAAEMRPSPRPAAAPATIRAATTLSSAPALSVSLQEQVHSLEVVKRQQLQALLDRPSPVVEEPAPVAPPPSLEPERIDAPAVAEPTPIPAESTSPLLQWCENGRPIWAQQRFDVLLFRVSGLTLAVPLIALGHIHPLTDGLTPIFGQADWFMGLQPTPAGRIRTINTALFVMPERYDPAFLQSARYVVSIDGLDWGLAVDQVQQPTRLNPEDVTWRSERSKRPWLAGTVKAAMCALLDVPQMGRILQSHDRKRAGAAGR